MAGGRGQGTPCPGARCPWGQSGAGRWLSVRQVDCKGRNSCSIPTRPHLCLSQGRVPVSTPPRHHHRLLRCPSSTRPGALLETHPPRVLHVVPDSSSGSGPAGLSARRPLGHRTCQGACSLLLSCPGCGVPQPSSPVWVGTQKSALLMALPVQELQDGAGARSTDSAVGRGPGTTLVA